MVEQDETKLMSEKILAERAKLRGLDRIPYFSALVKRRLIGELGNVGKN